MDVLTGFSVGINLGGWLSQYAKFDHEHFRTFITEEDIVRIASWGMDHVRLPVDYPLLEDDAHPFEYLESGFAYIDQCIEWCRKAGLNLVLDIHRAPGYTFTALQESNLFQSEATQERFFKLWEAIAARYAGVRQPEVIFELLNEVVLPSSEPWNALVAKLVQRIRQIDTQHWIMVGGNHYNSIKTLKEIDLLPDPRVVYTFHFYEPFPFTHQKAYWMPVMTAFGQTVNYPGPVAGLDEFLNQNPQFAGDSGIEPFRKAVMDATFIGHLLKNATDFCAATGKPLYCGEFGAIDQAPMDGRIRWNRDVIALFRQHSIGRAYWSYKEMDFGVVNQAGQVISEELVETIALK